MRYSLNKRKLPRKNNDINNLRCIAKAIQNHFLVNAKLLNVTYQKYRGYLKTLEDFGVIIRVGKGFKVEDYNINDIKKYKKIIKNHNIKLIVDLKVVRAEIE